MVKRWPQVPGGTVVVAARDYDALATELAEWKRMRNEAMAVATSNRERIRELEAALQHWLNAYGSTDALSSDTRDLLATSERNTK